MKNYNNPYKFPLDLNFMDVEKYFLVEKMKERFMIDAFNLNIIKQKGNKLEMLSSKVTKPKEIGIILDKDRQISCTDDRYNIKEITKKEAFEALEDISNNYSLWQHYMSNSDDYGSFHLSQGGDALY